MLCRLKLVTSARHDCFVQAALDSESKVSHIWGRQKGDDVSMLGECRETRNDFDDDLWVLLRDAQGGERWWWKNAVENSKWIIKWRKETAAINKEQELRAAAGKRKNLYDKSRVCVFFFVRNQEDSSSLCAGSDAAAARRWFRFSSWKSLVFPLSSSSSSFFPLFFSIVDDDSRVESC